MAYIYDLADVWSASGTTFTAIKMNVTDTASAAGSLLMDLQVGGSSFFSVRTNGRIIAGAATTQMAFSPTDKSLIVGVQGTVNGGIRHISGSSITLLAGVGYSTTHTGDAMLNGASGLVGWHGGAYSFSNLTHDLALVRDAANTLAQRNGVNAQAFNLYNTYTDASNYERGFMRFVSNVLQIGAEKLGTGTQRALRFYAFADAASVFLEYTGATLTFNYYGRPWTLGDGFMSMKSTGQYRWSSTTDATATNDLGLARDAANIVRVTNGSTGGGAMQLTEMTAPAAPATNNVRIYAEDDGAGKTRLMAVFATGAAVQIAIEP